LTKFAKLAIMNHKGGGFMYVHYMTVGKDLEITRTELMGDKVNVYVEQPTDSDNGFKHLLCELPTFKILDRFDVSDEDFNNWMGWIKANTPLIIESATFGGLFNADVI